MKPIPIITSYQRAWLRKQAHHLSPVVNVGTAGMTPAVEKAVEEALSHHELIKIKFYELKDQRRDACNYLAETLGAILVSVIGNIGILYRPASNPDASNYHLPKHD